MTARSRSWSPAAAVVFCGIGVLGLFLPLVQTTSSIAGIASLGEVDTSVAAIPWVGAVLVLIGLGLSALPVVDVVTGRVRLTPLLLLPAVICLVPAAVLAVAALNLSGLADAFSAIVPPDVLAIGIGPGVVVLSVAEVGILVCAAMATLNVVRSHKSGKSVYPSTGPAPPRPDEDL